MATAQDEFNEMLRHKESRSHHPEDDNDDDDARSFLNLSDDNDDTPSASHADPDEPRPSFSQSRNTIPSTRYHANTGPKGVISDAQNFRDSRRMHRQSLRSVSSLAQNGQNGERFSREQVRAEKVGVESGEEEGDEELDQDFMKQWRKSRLRELQSRPRDGRAHHHQRAGSRRLYGGLTAVDGEGYLDAVDKSPPDTVVVVYIYDDYVRPSPPLPHVIIPPTNKKLFTLVLTTCVLLLVPRKHNPRTPPPPPRAQTPGHPLRQAALPRRRNGARRRARLTRLSRGG